MAQYRTIITAPNLHAIVIATADWFHKPITLKYNDEKKKLRVWLPDTKRKDYYQWYDSKQGDRYHLELRDPTMSEPIHL